MIDHTTLITYILIVLGFVFHSRTGDTPHHGARRELRNQGRHRDGSGNCGW